MPKVYICNDTGLDFTKAQNFGELVRVTNGPLNMFRPGIIKAEVQHAMQDFNLKEDYLLPAGGALAVGFAFHWLALYGATDDEEATVKLLLFDSKTREYVARSVDL